MFLRAVACAVALLAAAPVLAGGFARPVGTPAPAASLGGQVAVANLGGWSGGYAGGQVSAGGLTFDDSDDAVRSTFEDGTYDGALYGLHAGYMVDLGRFVLGAEGDFDGTRIAVDDAVEGETLDLLSVGSVLRGKVRVGFDAGSLLPYVTAGVAQVRLNAEVEDAESLIAENGFGGSFYGIGAAYMLNNSFVVGAEALHHSFGDAPNDGTDAGLGSITLRGSFRF